jgi:hypothetical protein
MCRYSIAFEMSEKRREKLRAAREEEAGLDEGILSLCLRILVHT